MRIGTIKIIHCLWISLFLGSTTFTQEEIPDLLTAAALAQTAEEQEAPTETDFSMPPIGDVPTDTPSPVEEVTTEEVVTEESAPVDEPVAQETPSEPIPTTPPVEALPAEETPVTETPSEEAPAVEEVVAEEVPPTDVPIAETPAEETATEAVAVQETVTKETPTTPPTETPAEETPSVETTAAPEGTDLPSLPPSPVAQPDLPADQPTEQPAVEPTTTEETTVDEKTFGINTVNMDDPQGNWLFKRIWYEKAQSKYEKIKAAVDAILEARAPFFAKRSEIDRTVLDPFYITVGFGQGEMQAIVEGLIANLEKEREQEGELDEQERELLQKLQEEKTTLEQLKKDIEVVGTIDESIDTSLKTLMNEVNKARSYERQAWNNLKMIGEELSDQKAREKFYVIDTLWRNVQNITTYIQGPFSQYFEQLGSSAQSNVERIKATLEALKTKGIDFKTEAARLEEKDAAEKEKVEEPEEEEETVPVKKGWMQSTIDMVWRPIQAVSSFAVQGVQTVWDYAMSFFTGEPTEELVAIEVEEDVEVPEVESPVEELSETEVPAEESAPSMPPTDTVSAEETTEMPSTTEAPAEEVVTEEAPPTTTPPVEETSTEMPSTTEAPAEEVVTEEAPPTITPPVEATPTEMPPTTEEVVTPKEASMPPTS